MLPCSADLVVLPSLQVACHEAGRRQHRGVLASRSAAAPAAAAGGRQDAATRKGAPAGHEAACEVAARQSTAYMSGEGHRSRFEAVNNSRHSSVGTNCSVKVDQVCSRALWGNVAKM